MSHQIRNYVRWQSLGAILLSIFAFTGCDDATNDPTDSTVNEKQIVLNGAGATFPSPVYNNWSYNYSASMEESVLVNYQGTGSGAGVNQLKEGTVDFAGSDAPLAADEQKEQGLVQFPMLAGGVVVVVNIPGIKDSELKLSQNNLADIFLGKIKSWDDPAIVKDNPEIKLPALPISVVHRSDSSGTTFLFTNYLAKISKEWKEKIGDGKTVNWPIGIGGQKNPGVCNSVTKIQGSIGYTEYTYALESKLNMATLQNAAGKFIAPSQGSFAEAMKRADWEKSPGFYVILTNPEGEASYPIMGVTYILYRTDLDASKKAELHKYFNWCFVSGKSAAEKMHYISIPDSVVQAIKLNPGL